jgi:N-acetylneuraminic acid mutarotase
VIVVYSLSNCEKEKVATKEYPRIITLPVTEISESGAKFSAEIISGDVSTINECGFAWNYGDTLIIKEGVENNGFSGIAHSALVKGQNYEVCSYIKTDKYTVYGNKVSFVSLGSEAPVIEDFHPKTGTWGDTIHITGKNFRYKSNSIGVKLGDVFTPVISSTDTTIKVVIPSRKNLEKANFTVSISGNSSTSTSQFSYNLPHITKINPTTGTWGDTIRITGENFRNDTTGLEVKLGNIKLPVLSSTNTNIIAVIPEKKNSQISSITLSIFGFSSTSATQFSYNIPQISSISPLTGTYKDTVSIRGNNFSKDSVMNKIYFNEIRAKIIYNSPTLIKAIVPETLTALQSKISITGPTQNVEFGASFNLKSINLISFQPDTVFTSDQLISIRGENFNPVSANNKVTIKGIEAPIISSSGTLIKVRVPASLIPTNDFSIITNGEISVISSQQNARFDKKLEIFFKRKWTKMNDFPGESRQAGVGISINGKGYMGLGFSGNDSGPYYNDFWEYDPTNDQWTQKSDFPGVPRVSESYFALGDNGYIGLGSTNRNLSLESFLKDFYKYDPGTDKWTKIPDYPGKAMARAASFVKDQIAYVGTGRTKYDDEFMNEFENTIHNEIWKYDPAAQQWSQGSPYTTKTQNAHGFSIKNQGYIIESGVISEFNGTSWINRGQNYSLNNWDIISFSIEDCAYHISGSNSSVLVKYNKNTGELSTYFIPGQVISYLPAVFTIYNKAYIVSGTKGKKDVWEFDPSK